MNIGLDIHGVTDKYPRLIKFISFLLRSFGCKVFIITGSPEVLAEKELKRLGFIRYGNYDRILSVVDWLRRNLKESEVWQDERGEWWSSEENWWSSKAHMCVENNVTMHVDDSEKYLLGWDEINCSTSFFLLKNGSLKKVR